MNLSKQIKHYREKLALSQEALAEKLFVSRQTISNWENERSYPDIHNLLLLSVLFDVSLDELVKGDLEIMKKTIVQVNMDKYSKLMLLMFLLGALSTGLSCFLPDYWWLVVPLIFWSIGMYAALKIEKIKKRENIQTYKEILSFTEGTDVDNARKLRNIKKDRFTKLLIVIVFCLVVFTIAILSCLPYILFTSL